MTGPILGELETRWYCPSCPMTKATRRHHGDQIQTPLHECRGMALMTVPYVEEGVSAVHVALEREDYVGGELVQVNAEGRPIMSVETRRADGSNDTTVYAPTATGNGDSHGPQR